MNSRVEAILELRALLSDVTVLHHSFPKCTKVSVKDGWGFFPPPRLPTVKEFCNFVILRVEYFLLILGWHLLMTDSYLSDASTTSLNSTFPSLTLCPQCIYRPLPYLSLSLFCWDRQKSSNLFHDPSFSCYSLALSCTCSPLNLSLLSMSHWSGTRCSQSLALTHTGRTLPDAILGLWCLFFFLTSSESEKSVSS